jgi:hypothetical protein
MEPQLADKICKLSRGELQHPASLVPEDGGFCEHGNPFNLQPKEFNTKAKIITSASIIENVSIYYLHTGEDISDYFLLVYELLL